MLGKHCGDQIEAAPAVRLLLFLTIPSFPTTHPPMLDPNRLTNGSSEFVCCGDNPIWGLPLMAGSIMEGRLSACPCFVHTIPFLLFLVGFVLQCRCRVFSLVVDLRTGPHKTAGVPVASSLNLYFFVVVDAANCCFCIVLLGESPQLPKKSRIPSPDVVLVDW